MWKKPELQVFLRRLSWLNPTGFVNILISNQQNDLSLDHPSIELLIQEFIKAEGIRVDEISINFVDTPTICELHDEYFNDPSTTDCISFPLDDEEEEYRVLGEIFVCPHTAITYTLENGGDPYLELTLYIIHGLLHLIGYDDIEEEERQEMRARENFHLENCKKKLIQVQALSFP